MLAVAVMEPGRIEIIDIPNISRDQWPTRTAEAAAQAPLVEWIRSGAISRRDFVSAEYPIREAARAQKATTAPDAIKMLRF